MLAPCLVTSGIRYMVKNMEALNRSEIKQIEKKLDLCQNQENNPESEE